MSTSGEHILASTQQVSPLEVHDLVVSVLDREVANSEASTVSPMWRAIRDQYNDVSPTADLPVEEAWRAINTELAVRVLHRAGSELADLCFVNATSAGQWMLVGLSSDAFGLGARNRYKEWRALAAQAENPPASRAAIIRAGTETRIAANSTNNARQRHELTKKWLGFNSLLSEAESQGTVQSEWASRQRLDIAMRLKNKRGPDYPFASLPEVDDWFGMQFPMQYPDKVPALSIEDLPDSDAEEDMATRLRGLSLLAIGRGHPDHEQANHALRKLLDDQLRQGDVDDMVLCERYMSYFSKAEQLFLLTYAGCIYRNVMDLPLRASEYLVRLECMDLDLEEKSNVAVHLGRGDTETARSVALQLLQDAGRDPGKVARAVRDARILIDHVEWR